MTASLTQDDPEFQRLLAESETKRFQGFSDEALAWLALPPRWPLSLAEKCGSPETDRSPEDLLEHARSSKLVFAESFDDLRGQPEVSFRPTETMRTTLLDRAGKALGRTYLRDMAVDLAERITSVELKGLALDRDLATWARVASRAKGDITNIDWMYEEVDRHVVAGRTAQALELIEVAESLAPVLGEPFPSAARRGRRRLGIHYRRLDDDRFLKRYLSRPELTLAFDDLMAADDYWALHYVGMGGVGKTMLIRYMASRALGEQADPVPVARIDFDHIDPRFPATNPGELLRILGEELVAHTHTPEAEHRLALFRETMDRLAAVDARELAEHEPLAGFDTSEFAEALVQFADFVATLGRRVVFFLDTCEELAKLHPAAVDVPGIEGTFRILENVHDLLARVGVDLRVVLAGRRLLASRYRNFTPQLEPDAAAPSMVSLRDRSEYLQIQEIRGFTEDEADRYTEEAWGLDPEEFWKKSIDGETTIRDVVLQRSRETGRVAGFAGSADADIRYNPFDLFIYADWLKAGFTDFDQLAEGPDPYVRVRIVERFREESGVVQVLPAACLLGRFNTEMLAPALEPIGNDPRQAMHVLAEQEWVNPSALDGVQWLEIEPRLLPRIKSYMNVVMPEKLEAARHLLLPPLILRVEQRIAEGGLRVEHVESVLRMAADDEAARVWTSIVNRAAQERELGWLMTVTESLLGRLSEWDPVDPERPAARPAVWAGIQAAQLHLVAVSQGYQPSTAWQEVYDRSAEYADPDEAAQIRFQARFAQIAAREPSPTESWSGSSLEEYLASDDGQGSATPAAVAALEALVDRRTLPPGLPSLPPPPGEAKLPDVAVVGHWLERLEANRDPSDTRRSALIAFVHALRGRLLADAGHQDEAQDAFGVADALAGQSETHATFLGWKTPDHIQDRVALEHLLAPGGDPERDSGPWISEVLARLDSVDSERLVSKLLSDDVARGWLPIERLNEIRETIDSKGADSMVEFDSVCQSHRAVPRLPVTLADAYAAAGRFATADRILSDLLEAASLAGQPALVRQTRMAILRLVTLSRDASRYETSQRQAAATLDPSEAGVAWTLARITNAEYLLPGEEDSAWPEELRHAWWRVQEDADLDDDFVAGRVVELPESASLDSRLDAFEAVAMLDEDEATELLEPYEKPRIEASEFETPKHLVRGVALGILAPQRLDVVPDRAAARLLLEEGELLAGRLRFMGVAALQMAEVRFDRVGDAIGAFQAATLIARLQGGATSTTSLRRRHAAFVEELDTATRTEIVRPRALPDGSSAAWWSEWQAMYDSVAPSEVVDSDEPVLAATAAPEPGSVESVVPRQAVRQRQQASPPRASKGASGGLNRLARWARTVFLWYLAVLTGFTVVALLVGGFVGVAGPQPTAGSLIVALAVLLAGTAVLQFVLVAGFLRIPVKTLGRLNFRRFLTRADVELSSGSSAAGPSSTTGVEGGGLFPATVEMRTVVGRFWRLLWGVRVVARAAKPVTAEIVSPGQVPDLVRDRLALLGMWAMRRPLPMRLTMSPAYARWAWEASLNANGQDTSEWPVGPFEVWRQIAGVGPGATWAEEEQPPQLVSTLVPRNWQLAVEDGWKGAGIEVLAFDQEAVLGSGMNVEGVIHLMGLPALTPAGWRLRLDDPGVTSRSVVTKAVPKKATRGAASQVLLDPGEPLGTGFQFVVLQGTPGGGTSSRTAEELRLLGADMIVGGSELVLVIPQLGAILAGEVMALVAHRVHAALRDPRDLLTLVSDVRRLIASDSATPVGAVGEPAGSAAFDVALFARPGALGTKLER